jgi:hypothetical protein
MQDGLLSIIEGLGWRQTSLYMNERIACVICAHYQCQFSKLSRVYTAAAVTYCSKIWGGTLSHADGQPWLTACLSASPRAASVAAMPINCTTGSNCTHTDKEPTQRNIALHHQPIIGCHRVADYAYQEHSTSPADHCSKTDPLKTARIRD